MSEIMLNNILKIPEDEISNYKIKFNINNGEIEPLLVMTRDYEEIINWIAWKNDIDDLPRKRVIGLVRYYTVSAEQWVFVGIFDVYKKDNFSKIKNDV